MHDVGLQRVQQGKDSRWAGNTKWALVLYYIMQLVTSDCSQIFHDGSCRGSKEIVNATVYVKMSLVWEYFTVLQRKRAPYKSACCWSASEKLGNASSACSHCSYQWARACHNFMPHLHTYIYFIWVPQIPSHERDCPRNFGILKFFGALQLFYGKFWTELTC